MVLSIMELKKQFEAADKDKSGSISRAGYIKIIKKHILKISYYFIT